MMKGIGIVAAAMLLLGGIATAEAQDTSSRVDEICCGSSCCLISGTCYTTGETDPSDSCMECRPSSSNTMFTNTCSTGMDSGPGRTDAGSSSGGGDGGCQVASGSATGGALLALFGFVFMRRRE